MGRKLAEDDIVVFITKLHDFERLMRPEAVTDENSRFTIRPSFGLRAKNVLNPVQANFRVGVPGVGAGEMPAGGGIQGPVASMGRGESALTAFEIMESAFLHDNGFRPTQPENGV